MRLLVLVAVAALAACSGKSGGTLSVSTGMTRAAGAAASGGKAADPIAVGTHVVTLDRVRILVRKVELSPASSDGMGGGDSSGGSGMLTATSPTSSAGDGDTGDGSGSGGEDEAEPEFGPFVVDLSGAQLAGPLTLLFDQPVPAGTYEQLEFQIHKLTPGQTVTDPDFAPLGDSVILALTVDGQPVTFRSDLTAVSEIAGPFTVADGGTLNVTVSVDPSGWFTAGDGSFLDPSVDANRSAIEQNLRASIRGFEDDDHDGEPDHRS